MNQPKLPKLSEETINRMLNAQAKEHEIRLRELDIRQQEANAQAAFAHKMLQTQASDRDNERNHAHREHKMRLAFGAAFLLISLLFLAFIAWRGFASEALDVAKMVVSCAVGAVGGYGYRVIQDKKASGED